MVAGPAGTIRRMDGLADLLKLIPEASTLVLLTWFVIHTQREHRADRESYDASMDAMQQRHDVEIGRLRERITELESMMRKTQQVARDTQQIVKDEVADA